MIAAMTSATSIVALFGLGNPGLAYRKNRHNAGFLFLDHLTRHVRIPAQARKRRCHSILVPARLFDRDVLLVKPQTYMNLSGQAYRQVLDAYHLTPAQTLVIHDDLALPFGRARVRPRGSAGGHRGMDSIIRHAGTSEIPRFRLGIGAPPETVPAADYVLADFSPSEMILLTVIFGTVYNALEILMQDGIDKAMSSFN